MMKVIQMMIKLAMLVIATVIDYLFCVIVLYLLLSLHTIVKQHITEL